MQVWQLQEPFCNNCFPLESEDLSFWYKWKKWFLWTMVASQAAENHGDKWSLTWYFLWAIYKSIPTWTHSQNSVVAAEALSLKISFHGTSHIITKIVPISTRIVVSDAMKWGILLWIWWKVNGNWDSNMVKIFQWRKSHCRTNNWIRRKKKSKRAGLWESQSEIWVGKLTIWVRSFEIEKL